MRAPWGRPAPWPKAIEAVAAVLDMSDPDHKLFADSAADCLDALARQVPEALCREEGLKWRATAAPDTIAA